MILCAIISALFAVFSYIPHQQAAGQFSGNYSLATMIVSIFTFVFALPTGMLLLLKKNTQISIAFTVFSLLSGLSLSFIFMAIYPWIGVFIRGLVTEALIIILSTITLVLALIGRKRSAQTTTKSSN